MSGRKIRTRRRTTVAGDSQVRAKAIEGFVERLAQVRLDAGTPSFREMAKRSGAISHATLHDALQGARMPSWETTVEFAKACGVDPQELREDWERAAAIVHADCEGASAPDDEVAPQDVTSEATLEPASTDAAPPDVGSPQPARSRRPLLLIGGARHRRRPCRHRPDQRTATEHRGNLQHRRRGRRGLLQCAQPAQHDDGAQGVPGQCPGVPRDQDPRPLRWERVRR